MASARPPVKGESPTHVHTHPLDRRDEHLVNLFRELLDRLSHCDGPGAQRARNVLRDRGWTVIPPARWGKGVRR
jgi:hypothetical protein